MLDRKPCAFNVLLPAPIPGALGQYTWQRMARETCAGRAFAAGSGLPQESAAQLLPKRLKTFAAHD